MIIEITIKTDDNELIAKETAFNFESASEELGKLERYWKDTIEAAEQIGKAEAEFAKEYPDSKVSNKGENNEFVEGLTD